MGGFVLQTMARELITAEMSTADPGLEQGASNDVDHGRIRGILSHAFSDRALLSQEAMISSHIDHLVRRLRSLDGQPSKSFSAIFYVSILIWK